MKQNNAFTMLELVFVIIIMGVLAAMAIPRYQRDIRQEAADNVLSAIRYTRQLALVDDKTDPTNRQWQRRLWKITFTNGNTPLSVFYTISTDMDEDGVVDKEEAAINPTNGLYIYKNTGATAPLADDEDPNIVLGTRYSVSNIAFSGGCANSQHIAFDHLGRPFVNITGATNDFANLMPNDCQITLQFADGLADDITIVIEKQTGAAYIQGQPYS